MPSLFDLLHQKIELFRLEQRYTRHRHRRSTFVSDAIYVDGEYIYNTSSSNSPYSSHNSSNASSPSSRTTRADTWGRQDTSDRSGSDSDDVVTSPVERQAEMARAHTESKGSKRMSRLGLDKMDWRKSKQVGGPSRVSVREVKWER